MAEPKSPLPQLMGQIEAHGILLGAIAGALSNNPVFAPAVRMAYEAQMKLMEMEGRAEVLRPHVQSTLKHLLPKAQLPF